MYALDTVRNWLCHLLLAVMVLFGSGAVTASPVRVAAASSLQFMLADIGRAFSADGGEALQISYGSSGNLTRQIMRGAPFDVFFSAARVYVQKLADQGLLRGAPRVYARGRLVLFIPERSSLRADDTLQTLAEAAVQGRLRRLAIANPAHAPYGLAAQQTLQALGLAGVLGDKLVLGENAAQTTQFALTGAVDAALIPRAMVSVPEVRDRGRYMLVPEQLHAPLDQYLVVVDDGNPQVGEFVRLMASTRASEILERYGFEVAGPVPP